MTAAATALVAVVVAPKMPPRHFSFRLQPRVSAIAEPTSSRLGPTVWRVGLLAVLLLLALAWLLGRPTAWLTNQWRSELAAVPDEELRPRLRQAADLGEQGIPALTEALCSPHTALAEAAADVLDEELHRWRTLPPAETIGRRTALAEALAARVDRAEPDARTRAAAVAEQLLAWPADARAPAGRATLACQRVLEARPETWPSLSEPRRVSENRPGTQPPPSVPPTAR